MGLIQCYQAVCDECTNKIDAPPQPDGHSMIKSVMAHGGMAVSVSKLPTRMFCCRECFEAWKKRNPGRAPFHEIMYAS